MSDYESLIGRLTFEAGSGQGDSVCVTIEIVDDDVRGEHRIVRVCTL